MNPLEYCKRSSFFSRNFTRETGGQSRVSTTPSRDGVEVLHPQVVGSRNFHRRKRLDINCGKGRAEPTRCHGTRRVPPLSSARLPWLDPRTHGRRRDETILAQINTIVKKIICQYPFFRYNKRFWQSKIHPSGVFDFALWILILPPHSKVVEFHPLSSEGAGITRPGEGQSWKQNLLPKVSPGG